MTDEEKQLQLDLATEIGKLLTSRERWRKIALLCLPLVAVLLIMFVVQCAKFP